MTTQQVPELSRPPRPQRQHICQGLAEHVQTLRDSVDTETDMRIYVDALLRDACEAEASDIHLDPHSQGLTVRFRVEGVLLDVANLQWSHARRLINGLKTLTNLDPVNSFVPEESRQTYQLDDRTLDLRLAATPCLAGQKLTIRVLDPDRTAIPIEELGMNSDQQEAVRQWLGQATGMFLCTGPTGCGKTTTLYSLLHHFKMHERSAVTVEDPVEYQVDGITQIQVDEPRGLDFSLALKSMLRHDPDYLMVGEIRDSESATVAVDAAVTGKVVMSTLHARDAVGGLTSLRSHGLNDQLIAASLSFVVTQRLVPTLCEHCREQEKIWDSEARWLEAVGREVREKTWHAHGCQRCRGLGFARRSGVFELWPVTPEDVTSILHHVDASELRQQLRKRGHETLVDHGLVKADAGLMSVDSLRQAVGVTGG